MASSIAIACNSRRSPSTSGSHDRSRVEITDFLRRRTARSPARGGREQLPRTRSVWPPRVGCNGGSGGGRLRLVRIPIPSSCPVVTGPAQRPAGRGEQHVTESLRAPPVRRGGRFGLGALPGGLHL